MSGTRFLVAAAVLDPLDEGSLGINDPPPDLGEGDEFLLSKSSQRSVAYTDQESSFVLLEDVAIVEITNRLLCVDAFVLLHDSPCRCGG